VSRLKGPDRPINAFEDRAIMLAGLSSVDLVVGFSEDTPQELIEKVCPDILVKGGDYKLDEIVGREFVESQGGQVQIIPFKAGYSTSSFIEKIKNL
ncbi:MAG: bifunctional heptose 7-phosphate kinase/heptose 1-phosphate adenyltransferase, partial [Bacteroidia bacterium]|nr:bifunctional heptose 7-phosphate kinase/heptose 1-phosphate adenyltransferase [Bacteroidia bacterium]